MMAYLYELYREEGSLLYPREAGVSKGVTVLLVLCRCFHSTASQAIDPLSLSL
jgi:hypothetical protein